LIIQIDKLPDSGLDNQLGTFIAWKQGHKHGAVVEVGLVLVENRVHFGVAHERILGVQDAAVAGLARPRQGVVRTILWEAIVADADYFVLFVDDAGAYLRNSRISSGQRGR